MDPQKIETWVDQAIQQAQRNGDFDDLPGAGKPLRNIERTDDPDWWVKGLIEREKLDLSAAMPAVMALRRERAGFPESLRDLPDEAAVRAHLEDFNQRVLADRRRPWAGAGSPPIAGRVDVEDMLRQWADLRADSGPDLRHRAADAADAAAETSDDTTPAAAPRRWWRRRR